MSLLCSRSFCSFTHVHRHIFVTCVHTRTHQQKCESVVCCENLVKTTAWRHNRFERCGATTSCDTQAQREAFGMLGAASLRCGRTITRCCRRSASSRHMCTAISVVAAGEGNRHAQLARTAMLRCAAEFCQGHAHAEQILCYLIEHQRRAQRRVALASFILEADP